MPSYRNVIFLKSLSYPWGAKYDFFNIIGHLQGLPNHIIPLVYYSLKYTWSLSLNILDRNVIFRFPGMKIKIQIPYCTSTRHTQSYPRVSFVYFSKCRWSLSYKACMTEKKNENSRTLLCICKTLPTRSLNIIGYDWRCRRRSSDK